MMKLTLVSSIVLLLLGCEKNATQQNTEPKTISAVANEISPETSTTAKLTDKKNLVNKHKKSGSELKYMSTYWTDLMPEDDLDALLNPPDYIEDIAENSEQDQISSNTVNDVARAVASAVSDNANIKTDSKDAAYYQALASTRIIPGVNNLAIRLPAYIVPLGFDDDQRVTQFFMVPFFGACIHLPPPPPNQTIFAEYPQGLTLESLTEPYWVSGVIKTSLVENDTAIAAYSMEVHALEVYTDE
jgi:hypothetical protein